MQISEAQLLRRLRENDRAAFEEVVERHYRSIYQQLWHLCGETETAADLTQETFVQAWRSLHSFQGRSTLRTWLFTIAVRVWHRWKRGGSAEEQVLLEELADALPDLAPGAAQLGVRHGVQ